MLSEICHISYLYSSCYMFFVNLRVKEYSIHISIVVLYSSFTSHARVYREIDLFFIIVSYGLKKVVIVAVIFDTVFGGVWI